MKQEAAAVKVEEAPVEADVESTVKVVANPDDSFSDMRTELERLADMNLKSHVFCGVVGHENTGKTGIVMDALMKNEEAVANGDMLWVYDFDGGGAASRGAHYGNTPNIRVFDPWVMGKEDRTAYDYPATHNRLMRLGQFAVHQAQLQNEKNYEGSKLWGILVTAVDLWDSVCMNNMRIHDLGLASDAIEAADIRGAGTAERVQQQWDWAIRTNRFHQLTAICRRLVQNGVRVFWETHIKAEVFRDQETGGWKPSWEKHATNYLHQIIWCRRQKTREADGEDTGEEQYNVEFHKCKTNPDLQGQTRTIMVTRRDEPAQWYGLPELRDDVL
mgnify:CR=1 FL=1